MTGWLSTGDEEALRAVGRDPARIARALDRLAGEQPSTRLIRPAAVGDGIVQLSPDRAAALERHAVEAARAGRLSTFVPASGAATRLCAALWKAWERVQADGEFPSDAPPEVCEVMQHVPSMALWEPLKACGAQRDDPVSILAAMFGEGGLALHEKPKALIPFHRYGDQVRTAFDEHVVEAVLLAKDADGRVRVHMTVASEHWEAFERSGDRAIAEHADAHIDLSLSVQHPATDLPSLAADGTPFREDDGGLLLRPGGHGALLQNLEGCGGDVVLVKNIDNVVRAERRGPVIPWRRRIAGLLVETMGRAWSLVEALEQGEATAGARAFCHQTLGVDPGSDASALIARLHRPWRVAGMVRNTGKPGGGPFWTESPQGPSLQIVEKAQINLDDPEQVAIMEGSSHFNPVDLALGLRDRHGRAWRLEDWTNPSAVLFARKAHQGRPLRALEHPGLWNGQMARWNTVFVEIPEELFQPVKALSDLLEDGHTERA